MGRPLWALSGHEEHGPEFDLETTAQWQIRDAVRTLLAPDTGVLVEDAVLVVDEMVANALEHGSAPWRCRLTVRADPARLRVEVDDSGPGEPRLRTPDVDGGRGLLVIDRLASSWGVSRYVRFKTVWAELPLDRPHLPPVTAAP
ncbi:ATP-binding protein [Nocardia goodfellowii]|uniref:Anti-sigma regulatory factor (Ser/Thr protein kinase) n=1 Tax=Nocardia goodfellowii TaxID=882446 RepID=A0ABS4QEB6_9NOCA|nr:ATP-binding protein [Nocardia goodfellowii]MBP2189026.1 anti-sigma regulatory factor (Ser/Thr protein kinase) [Nocardia goodfellowii]